MKKLLISSCLTFSTVFSAALASDTAMPSVSNMDEMKSQGQSMQGDLGEALGAGDDDMLASLASSLGGSIGELQESLQSNEKLKSQLNGAVQSLLKNDDVDAVAALNKLSEANLTPSQKALFKDTYNAAAAFVTERNFSSLDGFEKQVGEIVEAVRVGNYQAAVQPLQKVWSEARLTDEQKELLSGVFDQYVPAWRGAADSLNKGLDAVKGLGL